VRYGAGVWAGPVLEAEVHFDSLREQVRLDGAQFSLITAKTQDLQNADGLFGLAYTGLNTAHDVRDYLSERGVDPPLTWPWPFDKEDENLKDFDTLLKEQPRVSPTPLITALANAGRIDNRFALMMRRPLVHVEDDTADTALLAADPLNQGVMVLGGSAEHDADDQFVLHEGKFSDIQIVHDLYYNAYLIAVQVGDGPRIDAPALDPKYEHRAASNAILDTGCSFLILEGTLYDAVMAAFAQQDERLSALSARFQQAFAHSSTGHCECGCRRARVARAAFHPAALPTAARPASPAPTSTTGRAMRCAQVRRTSSSPTSSRTGRTSRSSGCRCWSSATACSTAARATTACVRVAKARGADAAWCS
jgi:hypothetical protein